MFDFKLSLSSFRLCRRKAKSPATIHFFSPFNPKTLEIAYPTTPSPPPTTPNHRPHPLTTTPELHNSPVSFDIKISGDQDTIKGERNNMGSFDESYSFSYSDGETESKVGSGGKNGGEMRKSVVMSESLTVVKWSERPYDDFKRSMLEMILEKKMFEGKDLEQLLQCFLTLNSRHHHADIIAAFTEIWELLFL